MALFKISRGGENRLPPTITDGWAYFTPDTKNFFIDVNGSVGGQDFNERIQINEKPIRITKILSSSSWNTTTKTQSITVDSKITGVWYVLEVLPTSSTFSETSEIVKSNISYELAESSVIFKYNGIKPTQNIHIDMIFTPKERRIEVMTLMENGSYFRPAPSLMFYDGGTWNEWCIHGLQLHNLTGITKLNTSTIRVYMGSNQYFDLKVDGNGPRPNATYVVTNAVGFGAAEPN